MSTVNFKTGFDVPKNYNDENVRVQVARVSRVMANTIEKLKIAACLPNLLSNEAFLLRKCLPLDDVGFIQSTCARSSLMQCQAPKMERKRAVNRQGMSLALDIIWNNKELKQFALANHAVAADPIVLSLIDSVHTLKDIGETKMKIMAKEKRARESFLKLAWYQNQGMRKKIQDLNNKIKNQRNEYQMKILKAKETILSYQNKIQGQLQNFKQSARETVEYSEERMCTESSSSLQRQSQLSNDSKTTTNQYEAVLAQHLKVEKKLRANRLKFETQLSSWLTKYDADMGERQAEFEVVEERHDDQAKLVEVLQDEIKVQNEEFEALWLERQEEGLAKLRVTWAARIIQRFWRKYRPKKTTKGKAGKKKKKK